MYIWAINSAGECYLDKVEVVGSNPISPTSKKGRSLSRSGLFCSLI